MNWFISHIGTLIVALLLALAVFVAIRILYKNKKSGRHSCSGCSGDCSRCHYSDKSQK